MRIECKGFDPIFYRFCTFSRHVYARICRYYLRCIQARDLSGCNRINKRIRLRSLTESVPQKQYQRSSDPRFFKMHYLCYLLRFSNLVKIIRRRQQTFERTQGRTPWAQYTLQQRVEIKNYWACVMSYDPQVYTWVKANERSFAKLSITRTVCPILRPLCVNVWYIWYAAYHIPGICFR